MNRNRQENSTQDNVSSMKIKQLKICVLHYTQYLRARGASFCDVVVDKQLILLFFHRTHVKICADERLRQSFLFLL